MLLGPPSPLRAWELNDAFPDGMSLLQAYPLESAGGIDSILQTAVELSRRREDESKAVKANNTLGSRLRDTFWKGIANQSASPPSSPEKSEKSDEEPQDEGEGTETPSPTVDASSSAPGLATRLASVVWLGITNQSAMEAPPSPVSPLSSSSASPRPSSPISPLPPPSPSPVSPLPPDSPTSPTPLSSATSSLWNYAEKFRDSDAAASLSKVSTNWKVKAIQAWNKTSTSTSTSTSTPTGASDMSHVNPGTDQARRPSSEGSFNAYRERSFSGGFRSETYSPPPRPAYFRPPRDSMLPQPRRYAQSSPTSPDSADDTPSPQAKILRDSIASLAGLTLPIPSPSKPSPKSAPKPLLLNSASLVTRPSSSPLVRTPPLRLRGDSQSSAATAPESGKMKPRRHDSQSEWESDVLESRIVPLNRRSVSPMAPQYRTVHGGPVSSSSERGPIGQDLFLNREVNSPSGRSDGSASRGWGKVDRLDSPLTLPSSPPLYTPPPPTATSSHAAVSGAPSQRGSLVISEPNIRVLEAPVLARKLARKKTPPPSRVDYTSDSSAALDAPPRSPHQRSRRAAHTLATIHVQKDKPTEDSGISNTLILPESFDHENVVTPRAVAFEQPNESSTPSASPNSPTPTLPPIRTRKLSSESRKAHGDASEPRTRKISSSSHSPRTRKVSGGRSTTKHVDSGAEEGDDEGYDELLSAYESEDSFAHR